MKVYVKNLNKFKDINEFVRLAKKCCDEVRVGQNNWIINGKSTMGMYSLDLNSPFIVTINGNVDHNFVDDLKTSGIDAKIIE